MPSTLHPCVSPIRTKARAAAFIPQAGAPTYIMPSVYGVCTSTHTCINKLNLSSTVNGTEAQKSFYRVFFDTSLTMINYNH